MVVAAVAAAATIPSRKIEGKGVAREKGRTKRRRARQVGEEKSRS